METKIEPKQTVLISLLVLIVGSLSFIGGTSLDNYDPKMNYCEARQMVMLCDGYSKYYGLENGKCLNSETGNKLCRSGWVQVTNDFVLEVPEPPPEPEPPVDPGIPPEPFVGHEQWTCPNTGCIQISVAG